MKPHDLVCGLGKILLGKIDKKNHSEKPEKIEEMHKKICISSLFFGNFSLKYQIGVSTIEDLRGLHCESCISIYGSLRTAMPNFGVRMGGKKENKL